MKSTFAIACLFLSAFICHAQVSRNVVATSEIRAQQAQIRLDAEARKGRYKDMDQQARDNLRAQQDTVSRLIEGRQSSAELSQGDQVALFNALEAIESIINRAEEERMVCEQVRTIGSNRSKTVCKTVAQRNADREAARKSLEGRAGCNSVTGRCGGD